MLFFEKNFSAVIFDMDGTIFDTERLRFNLIKEASRQITGETISDIFLYDCIGIDVDAAEKLAKTRYDKTYPYREIRQLSEKLEKEYIRTHGVPVKDGLYNLLERLKKNNILLALATLNNRELVDEYLTITNIHEYFDAIICGGEIKKGKPDPEIFLKAIHELSCPPEECLIFEDSPIGILSASASGGTPILIKDIKEPTPNVKALAYKEYANIKDFLEDFIPFTPKIPAPQLDEYYPLMEEKITVGIHGFGSIGGGYLAPIFSHWDGYTRPNEIIGATQNQLIINIVNSLGKYKIGYESRAYFQTVYNVHLFDIAEETAMIDMYKRSVIIGLALPEKAIYKQANIIAKGLLNRYHNGGNNLTILIVMNKINAGKFVKNQVKRELEQLISKDESKKIIKRTEFIQTVVNRMVYTVSENYILTTLENNLYNMCVKSEDIKIDIKKISNFIAKYGQEENYDESQKNLYNLKPKGTELINIFEKLTSFAHLAKTISTLNIPLFNADPDIILYAEKGSKIVEQLRQVVIADIDRMQKIKNKLSNGTHAIIAWYSMLLGYDTIGQGMGDEKVRNLALNIMKYEIKPALLKENLGYTKYINSFITNFIQRCRSSFKDECTRIGRDCMRKLQSGERVIGAIQMAQHHSIETDGLEFGAACAILSCVLNKNPKDEESIKIKKLYEQNHSVADVLTYSGEYNKGQYNGLNAKNDYELIQRIQIAFDKLKDEVK